ncbi:hypothetical protein Hanom_Chr04g00334231 [Helianthus anomalus]
MNKKNVFDYMLIFGISVKVGLKNTNMPLFVFIRFIYRPIYGYGFDNSWNENGYGGYLLIWVSTSF